MNTEQALAYIHGQNRAFCKPGLERVSKLLEALGNPQDELRCIHIAGTNGKGSTSAMLASILSAEGLRVGLYTSPYVLHFNERIRYCGESISDEDLVRYTERIKAIADTMEDVPTEFEIITAIAFAYYRDRGADAVVLEVGLGGRFDATNVIKEPLVSVITGIAMDHTAILGDTIQKIAFEKAGIIKNGCPVVWGGTSCEAQEVIESIATQRQAPYRKTDLTALKLHESGLYGSRFDYKDLQNIEITLPGLYQPQNAITVLETVACLCERGILLKERSVREGLRQARWPARFEVLSTEPTVIFDGAHNAEGIDVAVRSVQQYFKERVLLITGVLADKDYLTIAARLREIGARALVITPDNPRALPAEKYAELLRELGVPSEPCATVKDAIERGVCLAKDMRLPLLCLGSLYTYHEVRAALKSALNV